MKPCPYCAEAIQDAAIKCKHCGEFLDGRPSGQNQSPKEKWYFRTIFLVLILGSIGPLGLPLVWWHPRLDRRWKVGLTALVLFITWLSIFVTMEAVKMMGSSYEELMQTIQAL